MKRVEFVYRVMSEIEITRDEVDHLLELSASHYDHKCKSVGAVGGFLYGWSMSFVHSLEKETPVSASGDQLDTLCKITEGFGADPLIAKKLRDLFDDVRQETHRINNQRVR